MADFLIQSGSHIRRDVQLVEFLIRSGADIHAMNADGMTPLDVVVATGGNSLQLARTYILHGAVVNAHSYPSLLHHAVLSMDIEMTNCILARGVDVNACDVDGETLLYKLCLEGDANAHTKAGGTRRYFPSPPNNLRVSQCFVEVDSGSRRRRGSSQWSG